MFTCLHDVIKMWRGGDQNEIISSLNVAVDMQS